MHSPSKLLVRKESDLVATPFGFGYFFRPLQDYAHGNLRRGAEVTVFEYLVFVGEYRLKKGDRCFWHSYATIEKRTGIGRKTVQRIVRKLETERFLTTDVKQQRGSLVTFYTVRYAHIATRMAYLFGGEEVNHSPEQLTRIASRQRALRRMARMQARLVSCKKKLLTSDEALLPALVRGR